jgi:small subunit ribosomal protein S2
VSLIDTDCDPDTIDLPIPGNDDGIRSIELIMKQLADAVAEGLNSQAAHEKAKPGPGGSRSREPVEAKE